MDYQRIFILLGLAVTAYLIILAWNEDYGKQAQDPAAPETTIAPATSANTDVLPSAAPAQQLATDVVPEAPSTVPQAVPGQVSNDVSSSIIKVRTDVLDLDINLLGGDIVRGALPAYPAALETPDIPYLLVDPRNNYAAQSGLIGRNGTDTAAGRPTFTAGQSSYEMGEADSLVVDLRLPTENGVSITKRFTLTRGEYLIQVDYFIDNQSDASWQAALFAQLKRDNGEPVLVDAPGMGLQPFVGGATYGVDGPYEKLSFDDVADDGYQAQINGGYMALIQHYFLSAWVPKGEGTNGFQARKLSNRNIYLFGYTSPLIEIAAGSKGTIGGQLYIGPKDQYRLEEISPGLNLTVDYGFLWWLSQPLFWLLTIMHSWFANWGVAIIMLTVIVKGLLYPLSAASYRSMAKMRKLQPEMVRLKDRYGDDRQQFSQAMMELYKKEGANPVGGCLPILLQMPVFLALYWTLMESVELRHAPFMLWINDLSAMDPYFVLPILMGISMYVTQSLQPEPPDPVQAKVFKFMPIMFTFFFLWFPSGLVLYWFVNNLLSIAQQWYVTKQIEKTG
jgi:YidC/Oxa1 family membrane protein insertase